MRRIAEILLVTTLLAVVVAPASWAQGTGHVFTYSTDEAVFLRYMEQEGDLPDGYHVYRRLGAGGQWTRLTTQLIAPILSADNLRQIAGLRAGILISMLGGDENTRQLSKQDFDRVLLNPESRGLFMAMTLAVPGLGEALGQVYVDRDLSEGGAFEYRVTAVRQGTETDVANSAPVEHGTPSEIPVPQGLVGEAQDAEAFINWVRDSSVELTHGIIGYNVYRAIGDVSQPFVRVNSTPVMNIRVVGDEPGDDPARFREGNLANGTTYWYRINAVNVFGFESDPTEAISVQPRDMTEPPSVGDLSARQTPGAVLLSWSPVEIDDLKGYQVFRSRADAQNFEQIAPSEGQTISFTSYADGDIVLGVQYWYRVRAVDNSGNIGPFSDVVDVFIEDPIPPPKVEGLRGSILEDNSIQLRWSPVDDPTLAGYMIERSLTPDDSAEFWFRLADQLQDTSFNDTLWDSQEGEVSYRVRAYDYSDNRGKWSDIVTLRPPDRLPPLPPLLIDLAIVEDGIRIRWEMVETPDLAGFNVWRSATKVDGYERLTKLALSDTVSEYLEMPPGYGNVFWYRVTAVDRDRNESAMSNPLGSVFTDRAPPSPPENLAAESRREGVRLTWTEPKSSDLEGYNIYRKSGDESATRLLDQLPRRGNSFTDYSAELGETYVYEVAAYDHKYNISRRTAPLTVRFEIVEDEGK